MFRQTLTKIPSRGVSSRAFSTTIRAMGAGDTGAPPKTGGQGDAFQRRERANEDYAIRQREKEKLLELRRKISEQQDHLKKLSDHIDELTREQGGEHN
ncbi:mitochondrial ATPase inhibitor, IATP-domain-containing protein [Xylaria flabelliformis]|nr:mitochondrial ATPase inhibitor, IATP-domain-containing protein [Xylaria flabelliformis]KAI0864154.1 putative mitochondrial ATPase inhibitor [Xylaria cubensis]